MVCFRIARAADWDDGGDARGTGRWRAATGDGGVSRDGDGRCGGGHRDVPRDPGTAGDGAWDSSARAVADGAVPGKTGAAAGSARHVCAGGARVRGRERDGGAGTGQTDRKSTRLN